jgi:hypothetical protein
MSCGRSTWIIKYALILPSLLLAGCGRAPSFDVVGSLFPAWLFCLAIAVLLTILTRGLFLHLRIALVPQALIYPSLTATFAFALWLIFFR